MEHPGTFWGVIAWMIVWGVIGSIAIRRRYLQHDLDTSNTTFVGGILVGLVEAAGTGCVPDPQKAASYIPAYGIVVLTLTLLLRPTGLFGRRFASGAHGKF